jgi:hypothetical protein
MIELSSSSGRGSRKRSRKKNGLQEEIKQDTPCSFCDNSSAAVMVQPPTLMKQRYYTAPQVHAQVDLERCHGRSREKSPNKDGVLDTSNSISLQPTLLELSHSHGVVYSCSSHDVEIVGSNTCRNQDATKGETWGNKDRADKIVTVLVHKFCLRA